MKAKKNKKETKKIENINNSQKIINEEPKKIYKRIENNSTKGMQYIQAEEGESIEEKIRRTTANNTTIEAISPMIYTERKDGVKQEYNIRADKWDIAQKAMNDIATGKRQKRTEKIAEKATTEITEKTAQPDAKSK